MAKWNAAELAERGKQTGNGRADPVSRAAERSQQQSEPPEGGHKERQVLLLRHRNTECHHLELQSSRALGCLAGVLWETFLFAERFKRAVYRGQSPDFFFWKTRKGLEFEWGRREPLPPRDWRTSHPEAAWSVVNRETYLDFVL